MVKNLQRIALATVGCKVNQYETQLIRERLERAGYKIVPFSSGADVYIINTCSVTQTADGKSIDLIKRAFKKNSSAKILVTGCLVEADSERIKNKVPSCLIIKNSDKLKIDTLLSLQKPSDDDFTIHSFFGHERAFVKVEDGCDQFCSYCRIPYVRGNKIRSRKPEEVFSEIKQLYRAGYREIVLTGVNLALYGKDLNPPVSLTHLLERVSFCISEEGRIRLSSLEPHLIPEGLLDLMASTPFICPHLHLAFQSGDDEILQRMGRKYTTSWLRELVGSIRQKIPDAGLSGDVIVGFPGEREDNFYRTLQFIKEAGFHRLHIFPFSSRPETPASKMKPKVSERIKKQRGKILKELSLNLSREFIERFIGKNLPVLIESKRDVRTGYLTGYTHNYIKVLACYRNNINQLTGKIVQVKIIRAEPGYALGEIV
ncbi:tRNA (N(6)-L-threonylcarbamoyladenosine(37)-C(2))-methylthiotransferase MtaB [Candidatus Aerophobetes bacterium]|uniref:tRNA (N(6)-L-threonylcarbamoyladenosine(37)-C(2))-methylthiotransferase n=1 Tax=Aerophobetes bacterium TaxID=2030807 RepID=A0A662DI38_UNCAE|nr:MAG: tRNA (N(6)-L-threonylcarbamoyladenosine(37)-C(2))-methylthiotransferase MtaB [Candidatus Aerophobetes bacterium]